MSSASSEPGGKAANPSFAPGKPPSASKLSDSAPTPFFPFPFLPPASRATDGDPARLSSTSIGVPGTVALSIGASSSSTATGSSCSTSMFQSVSYSMTVAAALVMWSRAYFSIRSASLWKIVPGGLKVFAFVVTSLRSD